MYMIAATISTITMIIEASAARMLISGIIERIPQMTAAMVHIRLIFHTVSPFAAIEFSPILRSRPDATRDDKY